jgi:hypothetical protein
MIHTKMSLIEAAEEFLSRDTSTKIYEAITGTYNNERGGPVLNVNHKSEASALGSRIKHHSTDISAGTEEHSDEDHAHNVKSHELATKAKELHSAAHKVHTNPKSSEADKTHATAKAVHATTKYWRHEPKSSHDFGSDRNETKFDDNIHYHKHVADHPKD